MSEYSRVRTQTEGITSDAGGIGIKDLDAQTPWRAINGTGPDGITERVAWDVATVDRGMGPPTATDWEWIPLPTGSSANEVFIWGPYELTASASVAP